jgi:hypothetical protein
MERDLKIDLIRGLVMVMLITIHVEFYSLYGFFFWERIGVVTGAEGFVILSGVVIGMVYKRVIERDGWRVAARKLLRRACQLWLVNVVLIFLIAFLNRFVNLSELMTYTDRDDTGQVFQLFPASGTPIHDWIVQAVRLQIGPHQLQILGLYVIVLALSPFTLWLMSRGWTYVVLAVSWALYITNWMHPLKPTGCMFEDAFYVLAWQLIFVHGQALGFHRQAVLDFFKKPSGHRVFAVMLAIFAAFFFWAQNAPDNVVPHLSLIPAGVYDKVYNGYMMKDSLGILRVVNDFVALFVLYAFLTRFWEPINKAVGWLLIPIGQASLYVFIVHIWFVALVTCFLPYGYAVPHFWLNTLAHTAVIMSLWLMVRYRVLFSVVPR